MTIRPAGDEDVDSVLELLDCGRRIMRESGNFSQWPVGYPSRETVLRDIELSQSYLVKEGGRLVATFVLQLGKETTYTRIYDGKWGREEEYGTIHRIAKRGDAPVGIFGFCLEYCLSKIGYIRIDTHKDNVIMGKVLEKYGFVRCGTIFLLDGSPRIAYELKQC